MKRFELIALDMDGTTLNKKGEISEANRIAINEIYKMGIKVSLISGRSMESLTKYAHILGIDGYHGAMNGNIVFDVKSSEKLIEHHVDVEILKQLIKISQVTTSILVVFIDDDTYVEDLSHPFAGILQKFTDRKLIEMGDALDFLCLNAALDKVTKIAFLNEYEDLLKLKNTELLPFHNSLNMVFSLPFCLEIFSRTASKGSCLLEICNLYGIDPKNTLAMGDAENDIEMLKNSGYGISPANCMPTVIEYADEITTTNEKNAVAEVIKKYFL